MKTNYLKLKISAVIFTLWTMLSICLISEIHAQKTASETGWSSAAAIDPLKSESGDFLKADLREIQARANEAYSKSKHLEAARLYLFLLRHDIHNINAIYNLSCCYGLAGKAELAAKYLKLAVDAGFDDIDQINLDKDFDNVRGKPTFDKVSDDIATLIKDRWRSGGETIFVGAQRLFRCKMQSPSGFNKSKPIKLIIALHGFGSNADQFSEIWKYFDDPDFLFAAPQAPYEHPGILEGYSWEMIDRDLHRSDSVYDITENYVLETIRDIRKQYQISDVYLLGFSQGAEYAYNIGIRHPELFKGIIPMGGRLDTNRLLESEITAAKMLKIFISHGRDDKVVEYKNGENARDLLKKHGYDVTFNDFKGAHTVDKNALNAVQGWLKKHP